MNSNKYILLFICSVVSFNLMSQTCAADIDLLSEPPGIFPKPYFEDTQVGGIRVEAQIGCPYEFVFHVVSGIGGAPICHFDIDFSVSLTDAFLNLPNGLEYTCNPPDCIFEDPNVGCIVLHGIPDDTVGVYDVKLLITAILLNGQLVLEDTIPGMLTNDGNYFLTLVDEPDDPTDCIVGIVEYNNNFTFDVTISPNPAYDFASITIESEIRDELEFVLLDLTGKIIQERVFQVDQGTNTFEVDFNDIPNGIYLYAIRNELGVLSNRIVVAKH